jgi:hypothetical protein
MRYIPPTWHNNYDNSWNLKVVKGKILPKAAYRAYAAGVNLRLEQEKSSERLVWDDITTSFVLRFISSVEPD